MNLKEETLACLERNGKSIQDIVAVCGAEFSIPLDNFISLADTDYDNRSGDAEVAHDLKIIGKDFVMVREEDEGSEWWYYIDTIPPKKTESVCGLTKKQAIDSIESEFLKKQIENELKDKNVIFINTLYSYNLLKKKMEYI